ncbi:MAG TPA: hypothetical protein VKA30_12835 [Actinomycetota bacterium]|nr:hypothetical protein [Actinomycetota bacterium]
MATAAPRPSGSPRPARSSPKRGERRTTTGGRLRVVAPPRRRRRRVPFLILATVLVGGLVLGVVTLQALVAQTSFQMEDLARRGVTLRQEHDQLRLEIARLSSPGRIAREAEEIGLRLPDPSEVKTLPVRGSG